MATKKKKALVGQQKFMNELKTQVYEKLDKFGLTGAQKKSVWGEIRPEAKKRLEKQVPRGQKEAIMLLNKMLKE